MDKTTIFISILVTITILGLIGAIVTSCDASRNIHYNLARECVKEGGTWIDTSNGGTYSGNCINGYRNKQQ